MYEDSRTQPNAAVLIELPIAAVLSVLPIY